jgi:hypothetical protein
VFLLSLLQKHFGFTEQTHMEIHIPIQAIAKIIKINDGTKRGITSEIDFVPSIKSRRVNSSKSDVKGKLLVSYSL